MQILDRFSHILNDDFSINYAYKNSDFDLNPDAKRNPNPPKPSAVLVPLVKRDNGIMLILTRRSHALRNHSGQIAFPGGRFDDADGDLLQTAMREAHEEIGLESQYIKPIGAGDNYLSGTNYLIKPIIAQINIDAQFKLNPNEVDEIFEVPLDFVLNAKNHEIRTYYMDGKPRQFYAMTYEKYFIWGVTAGLLAGFSRELGALNE